VISFFVLCFVFGVVFTIASFALGAFGTQHIDVPGFDLDAGGADGAGHDGASISPFNLSTISAFLAWFGGAGYLLSRFSGLTALTPLAASFVAGFVGGSIIFITLTTYVLPRLTALRPEAFRVEGALGHVSVPVHAGGVGEVVCTLGAAPRS
jgi:hypothetical protein